MNMFTLSSRFFVVPAMLLLVGAFRSAGDLATSFEAPAYTGSAAGTLLPGQQGWTTPSIPGNPSADMMVYTYADNALGLVPNPSPTAGLQFVGGQKNSGAVIRSEAQGIGVDQGVYRVGVDFNMNYVGNPSLAQNNLGSISLRPLSVTQPSFYNSVRQWSPLKWGTAWDITYNVYDASGTLFTSGFSVGFALNHWYREVVTIDFSLNQITKAQLYDLSTPQLDPITITPGQQGEPLWYLYGGANSVNGVPTGVRLLVGSSTSTDPSLNYIMGFDNLSIVPEPSHIALLGLGALLLGLRLRRNKSS
jgi:hypothetical protein